jgi:hypothetical protein
MKLYPLLQMHNGLPYNAEALRLFATEAEQHQAWINSVKSIQIATGDIEDHIDIVDYASADAYYREYADGDLETELYILDPIELPHDLIKALIGVFIQTEGWKTFAKNHGNIGEAPSFAFNNDSGPIFPLSGGTLIISTGKTMVIPDWPPSQYEGMPPLRWQPDPITSGMAKIWADSKPKLDYSGSMMAPLAMGAKVVSLIHWADPTAPTPVLTISEAMHPTYYTEELGKMAFLRSALRLATQSEIETCENYLKEEVVGYGKDSLAANLDVVLMPGYFDNKPDWILSQEVDGLYFHTERDIDIHVQLSGEIKAFSDGVFIAAPTTVHELIELVESRPRREGK